MISSAFRFVGSKRRLPRPLQPSNSAAMPVSETQLPLPPSLLPRETSLFLDVDGTLADFVSPTASFDLGEDVRTLIRSLAERLDGRLAIVSGRTLDNLAEVIGCDGIELAGSHGLERRPADGQMDVRRRLPELDRLFDEIQAFSEANDLAWERKPGGAAIHFRDNPGHEQAVDAFVRQVAERFGMRHQHGSMVRELRIFGRDKGDVVREMMREPLFASGSPVFVGDDFTDEDGFAAAAELGGAGILVGPPRRTAARFGLPGVAAVREWLAGTE